MSWSFNPSEILSANGHAPAATSSAAPVVTEANPRASFEQLHAAFKTLPENEQDAHLKTMTTRGLGNDGMMVYLENLMNASPKGQELATSEAVLEQSRDAGNTLITKADTDRVVEHARNVTAQMMGNGANDRAILQAVSSLPGVNFETQKIVQDAAQQVLSTDSSNIFSSRNADTGVNAPSAAVATLETASLNPLTQNLLTGGIAKFDFAADEERRRQNLRPHPGAPTVSFAAVESTQVGADNSYAMLGDLSPTQGLPNLKGGRGQSGPDFS